MLRTSFLIILLLFKTLSKYAQTNDENIRLLVFQKRVLNKTFVFGKWTENGGTETQLTYLGEVKTKTGRNLKVVNSVWLWGLSKRATSRILIFNNENKYLGNYLLTMIHELPNELTNGNLIFKNSVGDCEKNQTTAINLKNGLPKQLFRNCEKDEGDVFSFQSK
ncbi:hypothetical protein [Pedobacter sandarakinus]|uniref:hypothetical protein n=1 Tax=Pedobacter sandarakinus TaxID=353156 RepID=UPI002245A867|nr:hypothetical protein [Pedobacter sandarakinus]MCX2575366.1 hypothetical protein [Pedobacter sandarakinus]